MSLVEPCGYTVARFVRRKLYGFFLFRLTDGTPFHHFGVALQETKLLFSPHFYETYVCILLVLDT